MWEARGFECLAEALPSITLPDESADVLYSYDLVEHMENHENVLRYFSEARRVLKPNGLLISIAPNAETIGSMFFLYEYQHSFQTALARLETMLAATGFNVELTRSFLSSYGLARSPLPRIGDRVRHTWHCCSRAARCSARCFEVSSGRRRCSRCTRICLTMLLWLREKQSREWLGHRGGCLWTMSTGGP